MAEACGGKDGGTPEGRRRAALIWSRLAWIVTRASALAASAANSRAALPASWNRRERGIGVTGVPGCFVVELGKVDEQSCGH